MTDIQGWTLNYNIPEWIPNDKTYNGGPLLTEIQYWTPNDRRTIMKSNDGQDKNDRHTRVDPK